MPNDNTHTGIDRPVSVTKPIAEWRSIQHVLRKNKLSGIADHIEECIALSRTPAEPKAGDWERYTFADAALLDALCYANANGVPIGQWSPGTPACDMLDGWLDGIPERDKAYRDIINWIRRALSSAAPRITEEMVERASAELLESYGKWSPDYRHGVTDMKDAILALLRHQGAERKWISVDERLPEPEDPVWITGNMKAANPGFLRNPSHLGQPLWCYESGTSCHGVTHWTPRFIDLPPPFTPTQTEE